MNLRKLGSGTMISPEQYGNILRVCASQDVVRTEVLRNHDDNLWWPVRVGDWRTRMLIAGLSSRISYRMIKTYQGVVNDLSLFDFAEIASMSDEEFRRVVKPIGLTEMRCGFWRSLVQFFKYLDDSLIEINNLSNDELIHMIQERVYGSAYKVAQCCVLYARGYYCGVMPVDSGMLQLLCPAMGLPAPTSSIGHEVLRKQLEFLTARVDCRGIANDEGYGSLSIPDDKPLTWWAHLVLIYYKRSFSRKSDPAGTPLRTHPLTKTQVTQFDSKHHMKLGGVKNLLLEGLDGVGKTTIASMLVSLGMKKTHFDHHDNVDDLFVFYSEIIDGLSNDPRRFVFDRFFVSELVYGPVFRHKSRLRRAQVISLLRRLSRQKTTLVYLEAPLSTLLSRRRGADADRLRLKHDQLKRKYELFIKLASQYIPILRINTRDNSPLQVLSQITGFEYPSILCPSVKINTDDRH